MTCIAAEAACSRDSVALLAPPHKLQVSSSELLVTSDSGMMERAGAERVTGLRWSFTFDTF